MVKNSTEIDGTSAKLVTVDVLESASYDRSFRLLFEGSKAATGESLSVLFDAFHSNPGCGCNGKLWAEIAKRVDLLEKYYERDVELDGYLSALAAGKKEWRTIDTTVDELETRMNELPPGAKQVALAVSGDRAVVLWRDLGA